MTEDTLNDTETLAEVLREHRRNDVDDPGAGQEPVRWRVKCDGLGCDFYAERPTWYEVCAAHEDHLGDVLAARTAALARDRDALAAKTLVEAADAMLGEDWWQTDWNDQYAVGDRDGRLRVREWLLARAAALAGPEDTAQDTQRDNEGSGPCKTWPRPDWCQSPCPGGICAPVPADHGTDRADEEGEA